MITNQTYYTQLQRAIDGGSLPQLQEALAAIRADFLRCEIEQKRMKSTEVVYDTFTKMCTNGLVDVRGTDDITPLMLACLRYQEKVLWGDKHGAIALNDIAAWLLQEQASVGAEGHRSPVRTVDRNTGKWIYTRGHGLNVMEALTWERLPPSVQQHIQPRRFIKEARRHPQQFAVAA